MRFTKIYIVIKILGEYYFKEIIKLICCFKILKLNAILNEIIENFKKIYFFSRKLQNSTKNTVVILYNYEEKGKFYKEVKLCPYYIIMLYLKMRQKLMLYIEHLIQILICFKEYLDIAIQTQKSKRVSV